jgi:hypothetical protein
MVQPRCESTNEKSWILCKWKLGPRGINTVEFNADLKTNQISVHSLDFNSELSSDEESRDSSDPILMSSVTHSGDVTDLHVNYQSFKFNFGSGCILRVHLLLVHLQMVL